MNLNVSSHAKERAFERYEIYFTRKKLKEFYQTIQNPKKTIKLDGNRLVCYFLNQWFLFTCDNGTVSTFLPREALTDNEKIILKNDSRYRQINNDAFHILESNLESRRTSTLVKPLDLPEEVTDDELPPDVLSAEEQLQNLCDSRC
jgi:hypothetical protein